MRPWLLLLSLLVSDLSPLGDGDRVMENYSWSLYTKLLLNGQMSPRGPEILQTRTEHHCVFIQRNCVYVLHRWRTSPCNWADTVRDDRGCCWFHQELAGMIYRKHIPALVISPRHEEVKRVPASLLKSNTLPGLPVISQINGETSRIAMVRIKHHPHRDPVWPLHHHTAASGHSFQAFSLEKPKSWSPARATFVQLRKMMLRKRCCAATAEMISCCFEKAEMRSALKIKKRAKGKTAQAQIRRKESTRRRAMDIKRPSRAAPPHSDISPSQIQRAAVRIIKKNEHLNMDEEQESVQRQLSLKAASSMYDDDADADDDDGFYVKRRHLLVPREKTGSINRLKHKTRASRDDNKEDFSGKIITKQAEFRRPEGGSETKRSRTDAAEKGEQQRLACIRQGGFTQKGDNNDVDRKQMLTGAQGEILIVLFLRDGETQTERKPILNPDTGWETVNIPMKEPGNPPPLTENFIINSKCECLKAILCLLQVNALRRTEGISLKPAKSAAEATTVSPFTEEEVTEVPATNNTLHGNMSINQTKQEEEAPSEEPVIPSPPSLKITETGTVKAEPIAETTTVNTQIKESTSSTEVFNHSSTRRSTDETPTTKMSPESETEPRYIKCKSHSNDNKTRAAAHESLSGLRMREDVPQDTTKLPESEETNRPGNERTGDQNDPKVNSFTFPAQTIHKQAADKLPQTTDDNTPLCRGLIHRTEAGWKHCVERYAGTGSKMFSSGEHEDVFKDTGEREHPPISRHEDNPLNDDEYDHFYYFDGKLKRVQNNFYPYYKRQRLRKRSPENGVITATKRGDMRENLLSYIQQLVLRNKNSRFK